jgi:transcriptional regulator with XRE-family HTH domain
VLNEIGPAAFEEAAEEARVELIAKKMKEAFSKWYRKELEAGRCQSLSDLGAALGVDKATASRYLSGKIRKPDVLKADLYLRKIGTSLKDVLPEELEFRRAVLSTAVAKTLSARGIKPGELGLNDEETLDRIAAVVKEVPMPDAAKRDQAAWVVWVKSAAVAVRRKLRDPVDQSEEGDRRRSCIEAICAGDWEVAKSYLPWHVIAVLFSVIEPLRELGLADIDLDKKDDGSEESQSPEDKSPELVRLYLRMNDSERVTYCGIDVLGNRPIREDRDLCRLRPVLLAHEPRQKVLDAIGREKTECLVHLQPTELARTLYLGWEGAVLEMRMELSLAGADPDTASETNWPSFRRRYCSNIWRRYRNGGFHCLWRQKRDEHGKELKEHIFLERSSEDVTAVVLLVPVVNEMTWAQAKNFVKQCFEEHLGCYKQAETWMKYVRSPSWNTSKRRCKWIGIRKGEPFWNYLEGHFSFAVQMVLDSWAGQHYASLWETERIGEFEILAGLSKGTEEVIPFSDKDEVPVRTILQKWGLVGKEFEESLRSFYLDVGVERDTREIVRPSPGSASVPDMVNSIREAAAGFAAIADGKKPPKSLIPTYDVTSSGADVLSRATILSVEQGFPQVYLLHILQGVLEQSSVCQFLKNWGKRNGNTYPNEVLTEVQDVLEQQTWLPELPGS